MQATKTRTLLKYAYERSCSWNIVSPKLNKNAAVSTPNIIRVISTQPQKLYETKLDIMMKKTSTPAGFSIRRIKNVDVEKALNFIKKNFFETEPISKSLKLSEKDASADLEKYARFCIYEGASFMALDENNEIAAVELNTVVHSCQKFVDKSKMINNPEFKNVIKFLYHNKREYDPFSHFDGLEKYLSIEMAVTDAKYQNLGLMHALMKQSCDEAISIGSKVVRCDATNSTSINAMSDFGFKKVHIAKYEDFKIDGKKVFNVEPPHTEAMVGYLTIH